MKLKDRTNQITAVLIYLRMKSGFSVESQVDNTEKKIYFLCRDYKLTARNCERIVQCTKQFVISCVRQVGLLSTALVDS